MSIFISHISGINNIRYIVSSPVYKGRGGGSKRSLATTPGWFQEISWNHPGVVLMSALNVWYGVCAIFFLLHLYTCVLFHCNVNE